MAEGMDGRIKVVRKVADVNRRALPEENLQRGSAESIRAMRQRTNVKHSPS